MSELDAVTPEQVTQTQAQLGREAEAYGYHLNPDARFVQDIVRGLLVNEKRYGYRSCPCRLASGARDKDLDIVCPCNYRDADLTEYGACLCALYVSEAVLRGQKKLGPVPERRPPADQRARAAVSPLTGPRGGLSLPVWRCQVCGYLCARDGPPELCPICKARQERFERFM